MNGYHRDTWNLRIPLVWRAFHHTTTSQFCNAALLSSIFILSASLHRHNFPRFLKVSIHSFIFFIHQLNSSLHRFHHFFLSIPYFAYAKHVHCFGSYIHHILRVHFIYLRFRLNMASGSVIDDSEITATSNMFSTLPEDVIPDYGGIWK
jgi:hypothetical protein